MLPPVDFRRGLNHIKDSKGTPVATHSHSADSSARLAQHFKYLCLEIQSHAARFQIKILPYRGEDLPHFNRLSHQKKLAVTEALSFQRSFFAMAEAEKLHPNSPALIRRMIEKMGLQAEPDIFDKFSELDTVEIYHSDGVSSFKNLKFFEFISLSLEEIYCLPIWVQAKVSLKVYLFFIELTLRMKLNLIHHTIRPRINWYQVREKFSDRNLLLINLNWISPLKKDGRCKGIITVNRSAFVR